MPCCNPLPWADPELTPAEREVWAAMRTAKAQRHRQQLNWRELFAVIQEMGYRRDDVPAAVAPQAA